MKVPYSMDESEPDLYGGMGGQRDEDYNCHGGDYTPDSNWSQPSVRVEPKIYTQGDMDLVIQANLKAIDEMREEVMEAYDNGYTSGFSAGVCCS